MYQADITKVSKFEIIKTLIDTRILLTCVVYIVNWVLGNVMKVYIGLACVWRSLTFTYVTRSMCDVYVLILKASLNLGQVLVLDMTYSTPVVNL